MLAALIILRNQVVPADHLVDCVWGDQPPANANGALQAYVSQPPAPAAAARRDGQAARRCHCARRSRLRAAAPARRRGRLDLRVGGRVGRLPSFTFEPEEYVDAYDEVTLARLRRARRTYDPEGVLAIGGVLG